MVADSYFESCAFVTCDENVINRFFKYKCRYKRYRLIVVKDKKLRKDFQEQYNKEESFVDGDDEIMLPLEYEAFMNSLFPTLVSLQKSLLWIIVHLDVLNLSSEEKRCIKNMLIILKVRLDDGREFNNIFDIGKMKSQFIKKEIL